MATEERENKNKFIVSIIKETCSTHGTSGGRQLLWVDGKQTLEELLSGKEKLRERFYCPDKSSQHGESGPRDLYFPSVIELSKDENGPWTMLFSEDNAGSNTSSTDNKDSPNVGMYSQPIGEIFSQFQYTHMRLRCTRGNGDLASTELSQEQICESANIPLIDMSKHMSYHSRNVANHPNPDDQDESTVSVRCEDAITQASEQTLSQEELEFLKQKKINIQESITNYNRELSGWNLRVKELDEMEKSINEYIRIHERNVRSQIVELQDRLKKQAGIIMNELKSMAKSKTDKISLVREHISKEIQEMKECSVAVENTLSLDNVDFSNATKDDTNIIHQQWPMPDLSSWLLPPVTIDFAVNFSSIMKEIQALSATFQDDDKLPDPDLTLQPPVFDEEKDVPVLVCSALQKNGTFTVSPKHDYDAILTLHKLSLEIRQQFLSDPTWQTYEQQATTPDVGELVCVRHPLDKKWYRAQVCESSKSGQYTQNEVTVMFMDYGNMLMVNTSSVLPYRDVAPSCAFQARVCSLFPSLDIRLTSKPVWTFYDITQQYSQLYCRVVQELNGKDIWHVELTGQQAGGKEQTQEDRISINKRVSEDIEITAKSGGICRDVRYKNEGANVVWVKTRQEPEQAMSDALLQDDSGLAKEREPSPSRSAHNMASDASLPKTPSSHEHVKENQAGSNNMVENALASPPVVSWADLMDSYDNSLLANAMDNNEYGTSLTVVSPSAVRVTPRLDDHKGESLERNVAVKNAELDISESGCAQEVETVSQSNQDIVHVDDIDQSTLSLDTNVVREEPVVEQEVPIESDADKPTVDRDTNHEDILGESIVTHVGSADNSTPDLAMNHNDEHSESILALAQEIVNDVVQEASRTITQQHAAHKQSEDSNVAVCKEAQPVRHDDVNHFDDSPTESHELGDVSADDMRQSAIETCHQEKFTQEPFLANVENKSDFPTDVVEYNTSSDNVRNTVLEHECHDDNDIFVDPQESSQSAGHMINGVTSGPDSVQLCSDKIVRDNSEHVDAAHGIPFEVIPQTSNDNYSAPPTPGTSSCLTDERIPLENESQLRKIDDPCSLSDSGADQNLSSNNDESNVSVEISGNDSQSAQITPSKAIKMYIPPSPDADEVPDWLAHSANHTPVVEQEKVVHGDTAEEHRDFVENTLNNENNPDAEEQNYVEVENGFDHDNAKWDNISESVHDTDESAAYSEQHPVGIGQIEARYFDTVAPMSVGPERPVPEPVQHADTTSDLPESEQDSLGSAFPAKVTSAISSQGHFTVQLCSTSTDLERQFQMLQFNLQKYGFSFVTVPEPTVGMMVLVEWKSTWYRAQVRKLSKKRAEVRLIDVGTIVSVKLGDVKELAEKFQEHPRQAVCCRFRPPSNTGFSEDAQRLFDMLTKDKILAVHVEEVNSSEDYVDVNLFDRSVNTEAPVNIYSCLLGTSCDFVMPDMSQPPPSFQTTAPMPDPTPNTNQGLSLDILLPQQEGESDVQYSQRQQMQQCLLSSVTPLAASQQPPQGGGPDISQWYQHTGPPPRHGGPYGTPQLPNLYQYQNLPHQNPMAPRYGGIREPHPYNSVHHESNQPSWSPSWTSAKTGSPSQRPRADAGDASTFRPENTEIEGKAQLKSPGGFDNDVWNEEQPEQHVSGPGAGDQGWNRRHGTPESQDYGHRRKTGRSYGRNPNTPPQQHNPQSYMARQQGRPHGRSLEPLVCFACREIGHMAKECPHNTDPRAQGQDHRSQSGQRGPRFGDRQSAM